MYILLVEELDTKRLFSWLLSRLFRGFTTPVFVTSVTPVSWFYHACFRDFCHACFVACHACFVVLPRLFSWLRVTPGYFTLVDCVSTPVFVTSCHAWLCYPRGLCVHACYRDFVSRLLFACVSSSMENKFFIIKSFPVDFKILWWNYFVMWYKFCTFGFYFSQIQVWW